MSVAALRRWVCRSVHLFESVCRMIESGGVSGDIDGIGFRRCFDPCGQTITGVSKPLPIQQGSVSYNRKGLGSWGDVIDRKPH